MKQYRSSGSVTDQECIDNWEFEELKINGKNEDARVYVSLEEVEHKPESRYYDYKLKLEKAFGNTKKNDITAAYTFDVPMFDTTQAFKIGHTCKNMEHKFYIKEDCSTKEKWAVKATAFSSFYRKQS